VFEGSPEIVSQGITGAGATFRPAPARACHEPAAVAFLPQFASHHRLQLREWRKAKWPEELAAAAAAAAKPGDAKRDG
jgi:hypothetical protein